MVEKVIIYDDGEYQDTKGLGFWEVGVNELGDQALVKITPGIVAVVRDGVSVSYFNDSLRTIVINDSLKVVEYD